MIAAMEGDATVEVVPHFFFIGAPRAGSTWLYKNLQQHPAVWVPPCKNISYFHPRFQIFRYQRFQKFGRELLTNGDPKVRRWYRRFFLRPFVDDRWYVSLFPANKVSGEIAESYCSLARPEIAHLHRVAPTAKIIFVLRNPIDRVLSQAKWGLALRRSRPLEDVPDTDFLTYIDRPGSRLRSNYSRSLDLWGEFFPKERFLVLFYDVLMNDPAKFLSEICSFLGVDFAGHFQSESPATRVQETANSALPESVVKHAARASKEEIDRLADRLGGPTLDWQRRTRELLT
jgi:hypothetical protein